MLGTDVEDADTQASVEEEEIHDAFVTRTGTGSTNLTSDGEYDGFQGSDKDDDRQQEDVFGASRARRAEQVVSEMTPFQHALPYNLNPRWGGEELPRDDSVVRMAGHENDAQFVCSQRLDDHRELSRRRPHRLKGSDLSEELDGFAVAATTASSSFPLSELISQHLPSKHDFTSEADYENQSSSLSPLNSRMQAEQYGRAVSKPETLHPFRTFSSGETGDARTDRNYSQSVDGYHRMSRSLIARSDYHKIQYDNGDDHDSTTGDHGTSKGEDELEDDEFMQIEDDDQESP